MEPTTKLVLSGAMIMAFGFILILLSPENKMNLLVGAFATGMGFIWFSENIIRKVVYLKFERRLKNNGTNKKTT